MTHYLFSAEAPKLPKRLPSFVKHCISNVPEHMLMPAANCIFPPAAAHMYDITFKYYIDNKDYEPGSAMEGCVGPSSVGKGFLAPIKKALSKDLREHDELSRRKLLDWANECRTKSKSKDKSKRPEDAAIYTPAADMTQPAFVQFLVDAENAGNRSILSDFNEVDLLDQCCGGHKKVTKVIRLNFDNDPYGQERFTPDGMTGNPTLRWKFNFSCVPQKAREFFRLSLIDGTVGRIGFSYVMRPPLGSKIRQGNYDEAYQQKISEYLLRLSNARGNIRIEKLDKLVRKLNEEMDATKSLYDDDLLTSLLDRSLVIAWLKGCLLYVAEGYRCTAEILNFVEWSFHYDMWSKVAIFGGQIKHCSENAGESNRKCGPSNMLDSLPQPFTLEDLEKLRMEMGKTPDGNQQINNWASRGLINRDESSKLIYKSAKYLGKPVEKEDSAVKQTTAADTKANLLGLCDDLGIPHSVMDPLFKGKD